MGEGSNNDQKNAVNAVQVPGCSKVHSSRMKGKAFASRVTTSC